MVERIIAKGFKGLDFDEPLSPRTVFTGAIGSGKSARAQALMFLATGTVPGHSSTSKRGGDIMDAIAMGDEVLVGAVIDGVLFERILKRGAKGNVTTTYRVEGAKYQKGVFDLEIGKVLRVVNPGDFLALSDAKKIETLLRLFPPKVKEGRSIAAINADCLKARDEVNSTTASLGGTEEALRSIMDSRASMEMPTGTLSEIRQEIQRAEAELAEANRQIGEEQANRAAVERPQEQAQESPKPQATGYGDPWDDPQPQQATQQATTFEQPTLLKPASTYASGGTATPPLTTGRDSAGGYVNSDPMDGFHSPPQRGGTGGGAFEVVSTKDITVMPGSRGVEIVGEMKVHAPDPCSCKGQYVANLKRILEALTETGCTSCAATMLVKKFIREAK